MVCLGVKVITRDFQVVLTFFKGDAQQVFRKKKKTDVTTTIKPNSGVVLVECWKLERLGSQLR